MSGKTWQSDEAEALVDEHPLAYKDVEEVMAAQARSRADRPPATTGPQLQGRKVTRDAATDRGTIPETSSVARRATLAAWQERSLSENCATRAVRSCAASTRVRRSS